MKFGLLQLLAFYLAPFLQVGCLRVSELKTLTSTVRNVQSETVTEMVILDQIFPQHGLPGTALNLVKKGKAVVQCALYLFSIFLTFYCRKSQQAELLRPVK